MTVAVLVKTTPKNAVKRIASQCGVNVLMASPMSAVKMTSMPARIVSAVFCFIFFSPQSL